LWDQEGRTVKRRRSGAVAVRPRAFLALMEYHERKRQQFRR
jgi:hypothetical protein